MVRFRSIVTVKYGRFADVLRGSEQLNEISRARGWKQAELLVPLAGENNVLVAEYEYPDLATFQRENDGAMGDAEWMKTFRSMADDIYPQSARTELLESAPHL